MTVQQQDPSFSGWMDRDWWASARRRVSDNLALGLALSMVSLVWVAGAVWNFSEQAAAAASLTFRMPHLLPLVLDGMAIAMAGVAWAAALDGRAAIGARVGNVVAIALSSLTSGWWGWARSGGDVPTVAIGAGVPVVALLAFEVLLSEIRRRVHRTRGLPAPKAVAWPRLIELLLAPRTTFVRWRRTTLDDLEAARTTVTVCVAEPVPAAEPRTEMTRPQAGGGRGDEELLALVRPLVAAGNGRPTVQAALGIGSGRAERLMRLAREKAAADADDDAPAAAEQGGAA